MSNKIKAKAFSYKKGDIVPPWIMITYNKSDGELYSGDGTIKFGQNGKLFVLPDGDLVIYKSRVRDRNACLARVGVSDSNIYCAGDKGNDLHCWPACRSAMRSFKLKNTVKTTMLPQSDPR